MPGSSGAVLTLTPQKTHTKRSVLLLHSEEAPNAAVSAQGIGGGEAWRNAGRKQGRQSLVDRTKVGLSTPVERYSRISRRQIRPYLSTPVDRYDRICRPPWKGTAMFSPQGAVDRTCSLSRRGAPRTTTVEHWPALSSVRVDELEHRWELAREGEGTEERKEGGEGRQRRRRKEGEAERTSYWFLKVCCQQARSGTERRGRAKDLGRGGGLKVCIRVSRMRR